MNAEHVDAAGAGPADPGLEYQSLGDFLQFFLASAYRRQVTDKHDIAWCPEPWLHQEGYERLEGLWLSREAALASEDLEALTNWWLLHADPTMCVLLDHDGPFKYCSVRHGHKEDMLPPLFMDFDKAPPELYAPIPGRPIVSEERPDVEGAPDVAA
ncbi:DUF4913 domain-containing protein [Nocardia brasiliensis]|uniref:DUF4913 domain-containing protein n=1 Tax=Nocardia brasiliensis TaxID=37326 RepID=UPI002454F9F7|nr:DUF4913 domain-containing protein [Nocardia brasiliensis]